MVMGSLKQETQVVVVGAGPGGYVAALHAANLGLEVVLVEERPALGGVCLLEGCIPSKTLIHAVELIDSVRHGEAMGLSFGDPRIDLDRLRAYTARVVSGLSTGVAGLLRRRGVEVVRGRARFESERVLRLEGSDLSAIEFRSCILATGSRINEIPPAYQKPVWSSAEALTLPEIPPRLLVVGGGYIGLEMGLVYAGLGSRVTVVEIFPRLLLGADPDLVELMLRACQRERGGAGRLEGCFEAILLESRVTGIEHRGDRFEVEVEHHGERRHLEAEQVLVAAGRKPNTDGLGLERLGLELTAQGQIEVTAECRTRVPHLIAIGDITPGPMLAHKASREGHVAAEIIAGQPSAFDNRAIPAVVFTRPEIAWTGITEEEARQQGRRVRVGRFPLAALGRARSIGRTEGVVKIICDEESELVLGVGIVGPAASELITEGTLAIEMGASLEDLMVTIHPHPTLSEALMEAAEVTAGQPIHINPPTRRPGRPPA
jgi:dihydrolipoamide dehydrogenase